MKILSLSILIKSSLIFNANYHPAKKKNIVQVKLEFMAAKKTVTGLC